MNEAQVRILENEKLAEAASSLPPEEIDQFLRDSCRDDDQIAEILELLSTNTSNDTLDWLPRHPALPSGDRAGERIKGFEIERKLGEGGMGQTFLARQISLNRQAALKVIKPIHQISLAANKRFLREIESLSKLNHPNVVICYDGGIADSGEPFIAMEYIDGSTIDEWAAKKDRSFVEIVEVCAEIADGLHYSHENGVVHRDVKPANVMIGRDGFAKIIDFGIARILSDDSQGPPPETLTLADSPIGSPAYSSPEQSRLIRATADHRTDIWGLGILLCELLNGHRVFTERPVEGVIEGDDLLMAASKRFGATEISRIRRLINKAASWLPENRFETAGEMAESLRALLGREQVSYRRDRKPSRVQGSVIPNSDLFDQDNFPASAFVIGADEFMKRAQDYSDVLQPGIREYHLEDFLTVVWDSLIGNPYLISKSNERSGAWSEPVRTIVRTVGAFFNRDRIDSEDASRYFEILRTIRDSGSTGSTAASKLLMRSLKAVVYDSNHKLSASEVTGILSRSMSNEEHWLLFAADLYLRCQAGYVRVDNELAEMLARVSLSYFTGHPNSPLTMLADFICRPLDVAKNMQFEQFFARIKEIAAVASTEQEAIWSINAFVIVRRVYLTDFDVIEHSNFLLEIIESVRRDVRTRSPRLMAMCLREMLYVFVGSRNVDYLVAYERQFRRLRQRLHPLERSNLQIEYAACVLIGERFLGRDFLPELSIHGLFRNGTMLDDSLFSNPVFDSARSKLTITDIGSDGMSLQRRTNWLLEYLTRMMKAYVEPTIISNPLTVRNFGALMRIYEKRNYLGQCIVRSLRAFLESDVPADARFFARASSLFAIVSAKDNVGLMLDCAERALNAGEYDVRVADAGIGRCLFRSFYFGTQEQKARARRLAAILESTITPGEGEPTMGWAYLAAILYSDRSVESEFVRDFSQVSESERRSVQRLAVKRDADLIVRFNDEMNNVVHYYENQGSYLAKVVARYMNHSELWNLLATTVYENRRPGDAKALRRASLFYSFAKSFARGASEYDQKFCYNFIRCQSRYYLESGDNVWSPFFKDTVFYLRRHDATLFHYKEQCVADFFTLLKAEWKFLSPEDRDSIRESVSQTRWLRSVDTKFMRKSAD